jgi:hypothetical protein
MEFLSPVWPRAARPCPPKRRPPRLEGARVALVDDNLDAPFTTRLAALLHERTGAAVRRLVKPSGTAPAPAELIDEAARGADVAVVGVGL